MTNKLIAILYRYTQACARLIAQYKTALNLVRDSVTDVEKFMNEYKVLIYTLIFIFIFLGLNSLLFQLECPAAVNRFKIGVPATIEHPTGAGHDNSKFAQYVAETVHVSFNFAFIYYCNNIRILIILIF